MRNEKLRKPKATTLILSETTGQIAEELTYQSKLRRAVFDGVSETDVREVVKGIVARGKAGDPRAIDQLFRFVLGAGTPVAITQHNHFENAAAATEEPAGAPGSQQRVESLRDAAAHGRALFPPQSA